MTEPHLVVAASVVVVFGLVGIAYVLSAMYVGGVAVKESMEADDGE